MRLLLSALIISSAIFSGPALGAWHFECKADLVIGLQFDEASRSWQQGRFRPNGEGYVVRRLTEEEQNEPLMPWLHGSAWGAFKGSSKFTLYGCPELSKDRSLFACGSLGMNFFFDLNSLRYQVYYLGGYVNGRDNNEDTPSIEIGRCKGLD